MKTNELSGIALDWAVGKCLGHTKFYNYGSYIRIPIQPTGLLTFCPSTDWAQGGPIIEREGIDLICYLDHWQAYIPANQTGARHLMKNPGDFSIYRSQKISNSIRAIGPTPLISAMRCYVASKLGDEIELPEELGVTA
jgi:hypothetical protein